MERDNLSYPSRYFHPYHIPLLSLGFYTAPKLAPVLGSQSASTGELQLPEYLLLQYAMA